MINTTVPEHLTLSTVSYQIVLSQCLVRYYSFVGDRNSNLLVRLNSYLYLYIMWVNIKVDACSLTTGYSEMNKTKSDRKSDENIRI